MSRAYDAKQHALSAHPEDRDKAIGLFLGYLGDFSEDDFQYEFNQSVEEYIFGDKRVITQ